MGARNCAGYAGAALGSAATAVLCVTRCHAGDSIGRTGHPGNAAETIAITLFFRGLWSEQCREMLLSFDHVHDRSATEALSCRVSILNLITRFRAAGVTLTAVTAQPIANISAELAERGLSLSIPVVSDPAFVLCQEYTSMGVALVMNEAMSRPRRSTSEVLRVRVPAACAVSCVVFSHVRSTVLHQRAWNCGAVLASLPYKLPLMSAGDLAATCHCHRRVPVKAHRCHPHGTQAFYR